MTDDDHDADAIVAAARAWMAADPDPDTRAELEALIGAVDDRAVLAELGDRFAGPLEFGTAGLRGPIGAGPRRMNRVVVRRAAAGLVRFLRHEHLHRTDVRVVIGYDARHKSDVFALDTAGVVTAAGGRALLLRGHVPTPVLAFAIRHLGADAGVMVTASHNPPADNGYKVYLGDGAQIVPPYDHLISAAIAEVAGSPIEVAEEGWTVVGADVVDDYVAAASHTVRSLTRDPPATALRVVYTPMHGVGGATARRLLAANGFADFHVVATQADPDPDFPTVAFPNPEEPGALDLALADAVRLGADIVLANDPDADRLAVCVDDPVAGGFRPLTGNEVGALLADEVLAATDGADRLVVTTLVSSRLLRAQARAAGVRFAETLTGFKWIMRAAFEDPTARFVFGYEEALGYAVGATVRDKDGLSAALAVARLAATARANGESVLDRLEVIARRFGLHATRGLSVPAFGVVDALLAGPPSEVAGRRVVALRDLQAGRDGLPPTEGIELELEGDARVVVRPSGTEPKTKAYLEVVVPVPAGPAGYAKARRTAASELEALAAAVGSLLTGR